MENIILDFFGEKIKISKPKDLSYLRILISEKFCLSNTDAIEILLYYIKENKKQYIINDEDYLNFLNQKISIIYLDIDQNSKLYLENKLKIQEEISPKSETNEIEKLNQSKKDIEKLENEFIQSYNEQLSELNKQIDALLAKRVELVNLKKNKIKEFLSKKEKIHKKLNEISKKNEKKEILKSEQKVENKEENNILSLNKVKEVLNNVVEKVKDVTNEYIFKNSEKQEKIGNIKKTTKDAIEEINNLSRLVINQSNNMIEEIDKSEGERIILKGAGKKLAAIEEDSDLCENCVYKNKHKLEHLSIKIKEGDSEGVFRGLKCKGCGSIIWEEN